MISNCSVFLLGTEYFENGNKKSEGMFKDSKLDGEGKNKDGEGINQIKKQSYFIFAFLLGILFEENGQKRFEGEFNNGEYWNGKCK